MKYIFALFLSIFIVHFANAGYSSIATISITSKSTVNETKYKLSIGDNVLGAFGKEKMNIEQLQDLEFFQKTINHEELSRGGKVNFSISIRNSRYCLLIKNNRDFLPNWFIIKPNDKIKIVENDGRFTFSGIGAKRIECQYLLSEIEYKYYGSPSNLNDDLLWFNKRDSLCFAGLSLLRTYKNILSHEDYSIIKANFITGCESIKFGEIAKKGGYACVGMNTNKASDNLFNALKGYTNPITETFNELGKDKTAQHNLIYLDFVVFEGYLLNNCFQKREPIKVQDCYEYLIRNYKGTSREWLIYRLVRKYVDKQYPGGNLRFCIDNALASNYIQNHSIDAFLLNIKNGFLPGEVAYNFALPDTSGKIIHLSDYKGKVVLLDFYFEHCGTCAALHPYLDTLRKKLAGKNFALIGVFWDTRRISNGEWLNIIHNNVFTNAETTNILAQRTKAGKDPELIHKLGSGVGGGMLVYVDKDGKYLQAPLNPVADGGKAALAFIEQNL